jgi:hypothetical protein
MAVLSREQAKERKQYDFEYVSQIWFDDFIDTIEHLYAEVDRLKEELALEISTKEKLQEILEEYAEAGL